jgi:uncharacterized membrane protein
MAAVSSHPRRDARRASRHDTPGDCATGSVEELTERNVRAIIELEQAAKLKRTLSQRMSHSIAKFCGSMAFFWVHVAWFGGWILMNTLPGVHHVDPFPFTFLTLLVSLEAIFLSTFILIAQNEETRQTDRRNALDLQINLLTEQENTKMLQLLGRIAQKLDVSLEDDRALSVLEQATRPEKLAEQIDEASEAAEKGA